MRLAQALFAPRAVALIGASGDANKNTARPQRYLRKHGYRARLNYSDYVIFIAKADRTRDSTGAYSPDVAYVAPGYAGSIYDQGGYIYAAGMTFSFEPCALVIAEHERDFQRMANVVRYEGEHLVLYHNDRRLFQQTADHSRGGGHPILQ